MEEVKEGSSVSADGGMPYVTSADRRVAVSDGGAAAGGAGARMELPSEGGDIVQDSFLQDYYCTFDRRLLQTIGSPMVPRHPTSPHSAIAAKVFPVKLLAQWLTYGNGEYKKLLVARRF